MPTGRLRACNSKEPCNKQLMNLECLDFTGKSQTSPLPYWTRYRSVNKGRSRFKIFPYRPHFRLASSIYIVYLTISSSVIANLSLGNTTGDRNFRDPRFSNHHALQTRLFFLLRNGKKVFLSSYRNTSKSVAEREMLSVCKAWSTAVLLRLSNIFYFAFVPPLNI